MLKIPRTQRINMAFAAIPDFFSKNFYVFGLLILLISACSPQEEVQIEASREPEGNSFVITNARVFTGSDIHPDADILVERGVIKVVGQGLVNSSDFPVLDVQGQTVTPGFIDAHTHSFFEAHLKDSLRFGVTTQLDMFTAIEFMQQFSAQRNSLEQTDTADLYSAGTMVTSAGGHGTQYGMLIPTISAPAEAPEYIAARIAEGSDWIKIAYEPDNRFVTSVDKVTMAAVIDEAHRQGLLALVHISKLAAAQDAVEAGADGLVHIFSDEIVDDELLALMQEREVFVIPTLSVVATVSGQKDRDFLINDPIISPQLSASQKGSLGANFGAIEVFKEVFSLDIAYENVRKMHAAGIPLLVGTDAPNPGTTHGASIHEELFHFVNAGILPLDALEAATRVPAEIFQLENRGVLQAGARADFVVFDGKPDEIISDSRKISQVFKNGYEVERNIAIEARNESNLPSLLEGAISTFDKDLSSKLGVAWIQTTDQLVNGTSSGDISQVEEDGNGFLRSQGRVETTFAFPWSGASLFFGVPNQRGLDWTAFEALSFRARGDERHISVMLFSRTTMERPAMVFIEVDGDWKSHSIALADFSGAALDEVYGFAITAGRPEGEFVLDIDDVLLR